MNYNCKQNIRPCRVQYGIGEERVQNDLAYTPADMLNASREGRAIAPANLSDQYFSESDYTQPYDFSVNPEYCRGVDINDVWEASMASKKKIRIAHQAGAFQPVTEGGD